MLRKDDKPLQQIIKRHCEREKLCANLKNSGEINNPILSIPHNSGLVPSNSSLQQYKQIEFKKFMIKFNHQRDQYCLLNTGEIIMLKT